MTSGRRSNIRGSKSFRRLLRGLPDAMRAEMVDVLNKSAPSAVAIIERRVGATTTSRSGRLRAGVKAKVFPRTLRLQVGFLGTKAGRARLLYAKILDLGRKAQTVAVTRRGASYQMRVRAIKPKRFVTGGLGALRDLIGDRLRGVWDRALSRISTGVE